MPKFKNEYGVSKIKYTQKCRCFCPIGKADYTKQLHRDYHSEEVDPGLLRNRQVHS